MKFGMIGDIHGSLYALKAISSDLKAKSITQYLIVGDLITDCIYPNEVLDLIQTLDEIVIKGNPEEVCLRLFRWFAQRVGRVGSNGDYCLVGKAVTPKQYYLS